MRHFRFDVSDECAPSDACFSVSGASLRSKKIRLMRLMRGSRWPNLVLRLSEYREAVVAAALSSITATGCRYRSRPQVDGSIDPGSGAPPSVICARCDASPPEADQRRPVRAASEPASAQEQTKDSPLHAAAGGGSQVAAVPRCRPQESSECLCALAKGLFAGTLYVIRSYPGRLVIAHFTSSVSPSLL
jgi:hypothetical protein